MTGVLIKESKDRFQTQRYKGEDNGKAQRGRPMKMEIEISVAHRKSWNVKVCQLPPEAGRGTEQILP